jgi:hypothetical protein
MKGNTMKDYVLAAAIGFALALLALSYFDILFK